MKVTIEDLRKAEEFLSVCEEKRDKLYFYEIGILVQEGDGEDMMNHIGLTYMTKEPYHSYVFNLEDSTNYKAFINELKEL